MERLRWQSHAHVRKITDASGRVWPFSISLSLSLSFYLISRFIALLLPSLLTESDCHELPRCSDPFIFSTQCSGEEPESFQRKPQPLTRDGFMRPCSQGKQNDSIY